MPHPDIVLLARAWLGTPYHHQASCRGAGTDCIGLIRGIYRELYGREAQALPAYTRDWAEAAGQETLLDAARRHLVEIAPSRSRAGRCPRLPLARRHHRQARRHPGHPHHHDPRHRRRAGERGLPLPLVAPPPRRRLRVSQSRRREIDAISVCVVSALEPVIRSSPLIRVIGVRGAARRW